VEVEVPGGQLHAVVFGSGARNFLGHGAGPAGWEAWLLPLQELSARGWRAGSYDHRGSGSSVFPAEAITAQALVDDVLRAMDALEFDRCVLGGESMGSVVAMLAAQARPDRIDGLVLCTPPPFVSAAAAPLWEGWENDLEGFSRWFVDTCMPEPDAAHLKPWALDVFTRGYARQGHAVMRALHEGGAAAVPDLTRITVPALVFMGSADVITPLSVCEMVADGLPNSTAATVDGMGHFPTITRAHELVDAITAQFC
jgi:pimeloyl-ACP methyl ester carboxylesterase